jgi:hypothetical protein
MLAEKEFDLEQLAQSAIDDAKVLKETLKGLVSKDESYRYNCFKVLLQISENKPLVLYPEWDYFMKLLKSDNAYHRCIAVNILANLTAIDTENRFENIFNAYFDVLDDKKLIPAIYVARNAGKIAKAKPHLQAHITERLLDIDKTHHKQKDLIKADIIESFEALYKDVQDKYRISAFVKEQLESSSPKTRKAAQSFLSKFGK